MAVFLVMLAVLCLINIKFGVKNGFEDYMSAQKTGAIKGIFVIIVFLSHLRQYIKINNSAFNGSFSDFMVFLGQLMVVMFLFYSGYGVMLGIIGKKNYVKNIPTKRVLKVLLHFDISILLFYVLGLLLGKNYSLKKLLLSFVGLDSIGNSVWFVFTIIILYLLTFAAFVFLRKHIIAGTSVMTVLSIAAVIVLKMIKGKEYWWYDTMLCYTLGMWYAIFKLKIDKILLPDFGKWFTLTASMGIIFFYGRNVMHDYPGNRYVFMAVALVFAIFVVLLTMRISINNGVLRWFGKRVFGIYILQRIPMIVLSHFGLNENPFLFSAVCFAITIVIAEIFERAMDKLDLALHLTSKRT